MSFKEFTAKPFDALDLLRVARKDAKKGLFFAMPTAGKTIFRGTLKNLRFFFTAGLALAFSFFVPAGPAVLDAAPAARVADATGLTSMEVVRHMGLGWNLGNTLEACGGWIKGQDVGAFETAWGNPITTKAMIDKIQEFGFNSVRIPVAWSNLMGSDYTINPKLLARVGQVVRYVTDDGMVAVVDIHWDGGWWSKFSTDYDGSLKRYTRMWSQIADYFKDYNGNLIFESLNEGGCWNDVWNRYGGGTDAQKLKAYGILNNINQKFVDLVRKSGGLNGERHLLIAGYATDIGLTVDPDFVMPKDPAGRCIVSVHYYTPYTFAGLEQDASWGKARRTWGTDADDAELNANMEKLKTRFLDHGIPVIVGEYGATVKNKDPDSVRRYILAVAGKAYGLGMCPMLWDPGSHFNRQTLEFNDPDLLKGFHKILEMKRE